MRHGIYMCKKVLYGKTGNPANVIVGWLYKDGKGHNDMTKQLDRSKTVNISLDEDGKE